MKKSLLTLVIGLAFSAYVSHAEVTPLSASSKVKFEDAPAAVQNIIKAQAGSAQIEDLEKGTLNGQTVYEAAYKHNGQHTELRVSESGTVVDTIVAGQSSGVTGTSTQTQTATTTKSTHTSDPAYNAGFKKDLSAGSKVSYNQLPENVKQLVRERLGSSHIEDIEKGKLDNALAYQIAFKKNGKNTEFRVTEDGKTANEVVAGKPVYWHRPLISAPQSVKNVVQSKLGSTPITAAITGEEGSQGRFYRYFYKKDGKDMELRVMKNGESVKEMAVTRPIIKESAGSAK